MKTIKRISTIVYKHKRQLVFYSNIDHKKKRTMAFNFCNQIMRTKYSNYPELKQNDILLNYNKFSYEKFEKVITGQFYDEDYKKVFGNDNKLPNKEKISQIYSFQDLSIKTNDPNYENTNIYLYFKEFYNFLSETETNTEKKRNIDIYIKCLCHIYMGNNIHNQIKNEISKNTNFYILKGDYFFSLGYYTLSQIGNPLLIKFYSKIGENFASSNFNIDNMIRHKNEYEIYLNHLTKKLISFIYYGSLGIKEILNGNCSILQEEILRNISFHYGLLLYLKEELFMLQNKSFEFFTKIDEFLNLFLFLWEGLGNIALYHLELMKNKIKELLNDKNCLKKYELIAVSLCSQLFDSIDSINLEKTKKNSENLKDHIRDLYKEIKCLVS